MDDIHKQEVHDKPITEAPGTPQWTPPPVPEPTRREWFVMYVERFGFLFASLLTVGVLAVVFINSDALLREPDTAPSPLSPAEPPASSSQPAALSITTQPASAAIFINGEFAGLSPLDAHTLTAGEHRLSVQKQDYASLDTVLMLASDPVVIHLSLRAVDQAVVMEESQDERPPELAADEPSRDPSPPTLEQETPPEPESVEEQSTITSEVASAAQDQAPLPAGAADTEQADEEQTDLSTEEAETLLSEEPLAEVGELQVQSQPSGASVWMGVQKVGITPVLLTDVEAGAREVTLRLEGYEPFTTTVMVAPQQRSEVGGALIQRLATLKILAKPWGNIYIDGKLHKSEASIWYTAKLPPGNHRVRIEHPSLGKWEQVVIVSLDEEGKIEVDFNKGNAQSQ